VYESYRLFVGLFILKIKDVGDDDDENSKLIQFLFNFLPTKSTTTTKTT
jgi:hypothetical protein